MDLTVALVGLATALIGMFTALLFRLERVHKLVNSRLDEALDRIEQLTNALAQSDTAVPDKPGRHEARR